MPLEELAASFVLGRLDAHELPKIAVDFVLDDTASEAMTLLAGEGKDAYAVDLRDLFERGLREMSVALPSRLDAIFIVRNRIARLVTSGEVTPREGARELYLLSSAHDDVIASVQHYLGDRLGVARIVGCYFEADDIDENDTDALTELDARIVDECSAIVAGTKRSHRHWRPSMILAGTWPGAASLYHSLRKRTPSIDALESLCNHVAASSYRELLFCTTSVSHLLVGQHRELEWETNILRIEPKDEHHLELRLHEVPFVEPKPYVTEATNLIQTFEKFLLKSKWISALSAERAKRE